jgi:radical SAM enzyme (TIGR01210 family)
MCDLWKSTLASDTPPGAIPEQIRRALATLPPARRVKLYNSGSFFDPRAVPPQDHEEIAVLVHGFERVVVESHPALMGDAVLRFRDLLVDGRLEVGMGLETAHPEVLDRLNKRMTVPSFAGAARFLREAGIALRVFVLVGLPFLGEEEGLEWTRRSVEVAARGEFAPPTLAALERATADGIRAARGLVLADLWNLDGLQGCGGCFPARAERLRAMNLGQAVVPVIGCGVCGGGS